MSELDPHKGKRKEMKSKSLIGRSAVSHICCFLEWLLADQPFLVRMRLIEKKIMKNFRKRRKIYTFSIQFIIYIFNFQFIIYGDGDLDA